MRTATYEDCNHDRSTHDHSRSPMGATFIMSTAIISSLTV